MNIRQSILVGTLAFGSLESQGADISEKEKWIVKLDTEKPYLAFVIMPHVQGAVCKVINNQRVYILPPNKKIPGTDTLMYLDEKMLATIYSSPECEKEKSPT